MRSQSTPLQAPPQLIDDEIDLREVAAALNRQKVLISGITLAAALISGLYAFTRKPVWRGGFKIVLENINGGSNGGRLAQLSSANPILSNLAGFGGSAGKSSLKTEIQILKSPSVLKPTYDFVKASKASAGRNVRKWTYQNWVKRNLTIELVKGTSVLNLAYQDTDESLILPVLKRITNTYQTYSNRDSAKSINNSLTFAKEQSNILRRKSQESNRELDEFKFTYGISDDDTQINLPGINKLISPLPQVPKALDPLAELGAINKELTRKLQFFTENDPSVKRLQKERQAILQYIDQTSGGVISIAGGGSKESNREILVQYKDLQRTAQRDSAALTAMDSKLLSLQIQKAQKRQPWELISTPTLLDKPVAPRKKRIVALGLLGGLVLGCGAGLVRDRRSGLVFSDDELKALLPCQLLERLPAVDPSQWGTTAQLLASGPLVQSDSVALVPIGHLAVEQIEAISIALRNALGDRPLVVTEDLLFCRDFSTQVLVTAPGAAQRQQLQQLREQLALQGTPVAGWLLIDPELEA